MENKKFELIDAIHKNDAEKVDRLISSGMNVNYGSVANSPLVLAVWSGNSIILELLLRAGADVNFEDEDGNKTWDNLTMIVDELKACTDLIENSKFIATQHENSSSFSACHVQMNQM